MVRKSGEKYNKKKNAETLDINLALYFEDSDNIKKNISEKNIIQFQVHP